MPFNTFTENKVENYLKENIGKNLSLRKIHKDLKISRRKIISLVKQSNNISVVKPLDVGSRAFFLHVYTYEMET
jgi:predicted AAA+ superfamily ATPase